MDGELIEMGAVIALGEGMTELKRIMDAFEPLSTPAYEKMLAERPDYKEFNDRKWAKLSAVMWATMGRAIRDQADELAALAGVRCPTLVIVGEQDLPFLGVSVEMAERIPGAELVVIPDAGHSPQFENADAWIAAVRGFLDAQLRQSPAA
jgi:3-oxoadipate enol-lactonase